MLGSWYSELVQSCLYGNRETINNNQEVKTQNLIQISSF